MFCCWCLVFNDILSTIRNVDEVAVLKKKNSFISKILPEDSKAAKWPYFKAKQKYLIQTLQFCGAAGIVF